MAKELIAKKTTMYHVWFLVYLRVLPQLHRHLLLHPIEPRAKVELGSSKHSENTHFPKDPDGENCLKTKLTRASCRTRAGTVVPRAEHFGDLVTADHKVLSEGSESYKT